MKIQVVSDLHSEVWGAQTIANHLQAIHDPTADMLVIAGDMANWRDLATAESLLSVAEKLWDFVIYVPGNHEYYGASTSVVASYPRHMVRVVSRPKMLFHSTFVVENEVEASHLDVQRFLCGTGWFSEGAVHQIPGDPKTGNYRDIKRGRHYGFSDFRHIQNLYPWYDEQHAEFRRLLEDELCEQDVVVSHHLPGEASVGPKFKGEVSNAYFVAGYQDLIEQRQPKLVIHGHTHDRFDYKIGATRVVCNPLGYPSERSLADYGPVVVEI